MLIKSIHSKNTLHPCNTEKLNQIERKPNKHSLQQILLTDPFKAIFKKYVPSIFVLTDQTIYPDVSWFKPNMLT